MRSFQFPAMALMAIALLGCASSGNVAEPEFTGAVIQVPAERMEEYWIADRSGLHGFRATAAPGPCTRVEVEYTVDSNGNVYDIEVIEAIPDDRFVDDAVRMLRMTEFNAADENPARTPIRTRMVNEIQRRGANCNEIDERFTGQEASDRAGFPLAVAGNRRDDIIRTRENK